MTWATLFAIVISISLLLGIAAVAMEKSQF